MSQLLIQCSHISISFDSKLIFDDISFSISRNDCFAIIGENGSGKTTLLHLISGDIKGDTGTRLQAPHITIGYLPQEVPIPSKDMTGRMYLENNAFTLLEHHMALCLEDPKRLEEWEKLHDEYSMKGGYHKPPIEKALQGLKIENELLDLPLHSLSSGQRVRIALAKSLLENPDLLLLDEPTNHLDNDMVAWLKTVLHERQGATVVVSHDRKFLNGACNKLLEVTNGQITSYGGNYDFYLEEQERLLERKLKAYYFQQERKEELHQRIKAMTFSKPKANPPKDRNIMCYDKRGELYQKSVQRTLDILKDELEEIEKNPISHPKPKGITGIKFDSPELSSSIAIEIEDVSKTFGEKPLFTKISHTLSRGERVILTGPNGAGKTTLLRGIYGEIPFDSGVVRYSPSVKMAYLDQEITRLPYEMTPFQYFESRFHLSEEDIRRELHKAALGQSSILHQPFSRLSVGQRKRLMLLSLILEKPNVLLLDEPTNHLDLLTLEAFEKALLSFSGAVLAVSHDSIFIEKIRTQEWILG